MMADTISLLIYCFTFSHIHCFILTLMVLIQSSDLIKSPFHLLNAEHLPCQNISRLSINQFIYRFMTYKSPKSIFSLAVYLSSIICLPISNPGFFSISTIDILGWMILRGMSCVCRACSRILNL